MQPLFLFNILLSFHARDFVLVSMKNKNRIYIAPYRWLKAPPFLYFHSFLFIHLQI